MLNRAHKSFFGRCAVAAAGAAFLVGATLQPADAATVVWSGSQVNDTGSQWYAQNLGYAFDPNTSGTVITGTLDISQLLAGDTLMFGLIDKKHKDGNGYMWQSGAYLYLSMQNATTVRFGVSDGNVGGEIVQVFSDISRPANNTVDFSLTIQGGSITLTSLLLGASQVDTYGDVKTLNNAFGYAWPEFANGAYLGTSMYFNDAQTPLNRSYSFDVTATNGSPVPLPAAAWLLLSGLGGLGFVARRKAS